MGDARLGCMNETKTLLDNLRFLSSAQQEICGHFLPGVFHGYLGRQSRLYNSVKPKRRL